MKTKTDPKTMKRRVELAAADKTACAKVIDLLENAARCDGEDGEESELMAAQLKEWVIAHSPKAKQDDRQTTMLSE